MARVPVKWTEKKIQAMQAEGWGKGTEALYKPWLVVDEVSSLGRSRRVWTAHRTVVLSNPLQIRNKISTALAE